MKKMIFSFMIAFMISYAYGQEFVPTQEDINTFFTTKTLVVLNDNPMSEYNFFVKKVMEQEWTITDYEFINQSEFEKKRLDHQYSFIYMSKVTFEHDKTDAQYRFLHLSLGGDYFRLNQMPDLAQIPIAYFGVDEDSYGYKFGILLRFMQNHAKHIKDNPKIVSSNVLKHYNDNIKKIQGKTLFLLEDELAKEVNTAARIKKIYPYKFKIVTQDEIERAIKERDDKVVFLHKVGPEGTKINARSYKILVGAGDANFYYFDYHKINKKKPDGFLASDFKRLAK